MVLGYSLAFDHRNSRIDRCFHIVDNRYMNDIGLGYMNFIGYSTLLLFFNYFTRIVLHLKFVPVLISKIRKTSRMATRQLRSLANA